MNRNIVASSSSSSSLILTAESRVFGYWVVVCPPGARFLGLTAPFLDRHSKFLLCNCAELLDEVAIQYVRRQKFWQLNKALSGGLASGTPRLLSKSSGLPSKSGNIAWTHNQINIWVYRMAWFPRDKSFRPRKWQKIIRYWVGKGIRGIRAFVAGLVLQSGGGWF